MDNLGENLNLDSDGSEIGSQGVSDTAHLNDFRAPELDVNGGGVDDVISVDELGEPIGGDFEPESIVEQMSKEAFFTVFRHGFGVPGLFAPDWRPLAIQEGETEIAREASDAIYELLEIYYPSALLPQGETFARIAKAAPFLFAKVLIVREILRAKREAKLAPPPKPQPANRDAAPAPEFQSSRAPAPNNDNGHYVAPLSEFSELDAA